jgi:hypothetical protein
VIPAFVRKTSKKQDLLQNGFKQDTVKKISVNYVVLDPVSPYKWMCIMLTAKEIIFHLTI